MLAATGNGQAAGPNRSDLPLPQVRAAGACLVTDRRACRLASRLDARQAAVRIDGNARRIRLRANRATGSGTPQTTRLKLCGQPRIQAALSGSGSKPEG